MTGKGIKLLLFQETVTVVLSLKNLATWPQHNQAKPPMQSPKVKKRQNWTKIEEQVSAFEAILQAIRKLNSEFDKNQK